MPLGFEWDRRKADTNFKKHSTSFTEAASVFGDPEAPIFADEDHSDVEEREIIIGYSLRKRLLLVCFTEIEQDKVRIISARGATRREQRDYEEHGTI